MKPLLLPAITRLFRGPPFSAPPSLWPSPFPLQAAFSPAFIHRPEGRRFLASLFNLDKGFVGELTAIIKNQVWECGG